MLFLENEQNEKRKKQYYNSTCIGDKKNGIYTCEILSQHTFFCPCKQKEVNDDDDDDDNGFIREAQRIEIKVSLVQGTILARTY